MRSCILNFTFWLTLTLKFRCHESETLSLVQALRTQNMSGGSLSLELRTPAFNMTWETERCQLWKAYCFISLHTTVVVVPSVFKRLAPPRAPQKQLFELFLSLVSSPVTRYKTVYRKCLGMFSFWYDILCETNVTKAYWNCHARVKGRKFRRLSNILRQKRSSETCFSWKTDPRHNLLAVWDCLQTIFHDLKSLEQFALCERRS